MNSQDNIRALTWGAVISAILLAVGVAVGLGMDRNAPQYSVPVDASAELDATATATATAGAGSTAGANAGLGATMLTAPDHSGAMLSGGAASTAAMTADAPSVRAENDTVKFFFAAGRLELAQGAREALGAIVKGVAAGQFAVISSFHDASGDAAQSQALAQRRAVAVRDALISLGIGEDKLQLRSPEAVAVGKDGNYEAHRVEVRLQ